MQEHGIYVVDDFYGDLGRVREHARACEWLKPDAMGPKFPGVESRRSFYSQTIVEKLSSILGKPIIVNEATLPFGIFSLGLAQHARNRVVHVDPCEWTAVVYLNEQKYCSGGTTLYSHRATGKNGLPSVGEMLSLGYSDSSKFFQEFYGQDQVNYEAWDTDVFLGMKPNRMVLYPAARFHAASGYFGQDFTDGRLIQLFFFNTLDS